MLGVTVQGGTGAGRKVVKPLPLWACRCKTETQMIGGKETPVLRLQLGATYSCGDCGMRRPT